MKRNNLLIIMSLLFAMPVMAQSPCWDGTAAAEYAGGDGSQEKPYLIATAEQLALLQQQTFAGNGNACYRLIDDICLNGSEGMIWDVIGNVDNPFTGTFDGAGHSISDFVQSANGKDIGIFGYTYGACISDLSVEGQVSNGISGYVGLIVAYAENTNIFRCHADGMIYGASCAGGIAGFYNVSLADNDTVRISECTNKANLHSSMDMGGMVGKTGITSGNAIIEKCINYGVINAFSFSGGMLGEGPVIIRNCENYGEIVSDLCSGGMVGQGFYEVIEGCINHESGTVSGEDIGGIIGCCGYTEIRACGNRATIRAKGNQYSAIMMGGIAGSGGSMSNCYNVGTITAEYLTQSLDYVGIGGISGATSDDGYIFNCYNAGEIVLPTVNVSNPIYGIIASAELHLSQLNNCYWHGDFSLRPCGIIIDSPGTTIPDGSSPFNEGSSSTSWELEIAQYGTSDLLDALNLGSMGECSWVEDIDMINGGFPVIGNAGWDEVASLPVSSVMLYPNPANSQIYVSLDKEIPIGTAYRIANMLGQTVQSGSLTGNQSVDVSNLPSGLYFFSMGQITMKFMVER